MTPNQRRSVRRRDAGSLDDGRRAFPLRAGDTEEMVRAIFDKYDPDLVLDGQTLVDWCPHTAQYQYDHGCGEFCERPTARIVWVARWPDERDGPTPSELSLIAETDPAEAHQVIASWTRGEA